MKINDVRATPATQAAAAYGAHRPVDGRAPGAPRPAKRADTASLSPEAQKLLKAHRASKASPSARTELVERLRREVQDGTYRVDEHALARRIAQRLTSDGV